MNALLINLNMHFELIFSKILDSTDFLINDPMILCFFSVLAVLFFACIVQTYRIKKVYKENATINEEKKELRQQLHESTGLYMDANQRLQVVIGKYKSLKRVIRKQSNQLEEINKQSMELSLEKSKPTISPSQKTNQSKLIDGIINDINQPLSLVNNGVETLKITIGDLISLIDYSQNPETEGQMENYGDNMEDLDLSIEELAKDVNELVSTISINSNYVMDVIRSLEVLRVKKKSKPLSLNINECIEGVILFLNSELEGLKVNRYFDQEMEDIDLNLEEVNQIFGNVILNATEAIAPEQNDGVITIYTENRTEELIIRIHDNGVGMTEETMSNIFNPFFTTKSSHLHNGLGLSITHGIIVENSGSVTAKSQYGKGTEIEILIPKK